MKQKRRQINLFKFFDEISELIGWFLIVLRATSLSFLVGCVVYICLQGAAGLVLGIAIMLLGMFLGVLFATRKFKTTGTIDLLSKVNATPELDSNNKKKTLQPNRRIRTKTVNNGII